MESLSKIIAYENGDILDVNSVKDLLFKYWELSIAELRAFDRLCKREDLKQRYANELKEQDNHKQ